MEPKTQFIQWVNTLAARGIDQRYRRELAKAVIASYEELEAKVQILEKEKGSPQA